MLYTYKALVTRVIDGDTFVCNIDLGFKLWMYNATVRLLNYNAPENKGPEKEYGVVAKSRLECLLCNKEIVINTVKTDAFGRYLVNAYLDDINLVDKLVLEGYGVYWNGQGVRPAFYDLLTYPLNS